MSKSPESTIDLNSWLAEELYHDYLHNRTAVDDTWQEVFEGNGHTAGPKSGNGANGTTLTQAAEPAQPAVAPPESAVPASVEPAKPAAPTKAAAVK